MRHAEAENTLGDDQHRSLTPDGLRDIELIARWIAQQGIKFDAIIASPYKRAQQTAQALKEHLHSPVTISTLALLTPHGSATDVHDYLDGILAVKPWNNVLLVSHMPLVSYLTEKMSVENVAPLFPTASVLHIDYSVERMNGSVAAHISPERLAH